MDQSQAKVAIELSQQLQPVAKLVQSFAYMPSVTGLSYFWNPELEKLAIVGNLAAAAPRRKLALDLGLPTHIAAKPPEWPWIKVAYSPTLRRAGELLNFFPGEYAQGVPNYPNPLTAALTTGLLGAGLGYGVGSLTGRPKTWSTLGALTAMLPAGAWAAYNCANDKSLNDSSLLNHPVPKTWEEEHGIKVGSSSMMEGLPPINVDALGRVLWHDPLLSNSMKLTTLAAVDAAAAVPDESAGPGWVTPMQMGRLAAGMGAGYLSGAMVGGALGLLARISPETQNRLRQAGMVAGMVQTLVPKLFR